MKSFRIWSFSGLYFPAFGMNMEGYGVSLISHFQKYYGNRSRNKTNGLGFIPLIFHFMQIFQQCGQPDNNQRQLFKSYTNERGFENKSAEKMNKLDKHSKKSLQIKHDAD